MKKRESSVGHAPQIFIGNTTPAGKKLLAYKAKKERELGVGITASQAVGCLFVEAEKAGVKIH